MILALDVGDIRIGTALSDEQEKFAYPLETFERTKGLAEQRIIDIIKEKRISTLVVGLPLGEHGERNNQCNKIESFVRRLNRRCPNVKIEFVDEYGTSEEAMEQLRTTGRSEKQIKEKKVLDSVSASIILKIYIDSRKG